MPANGIPVPKGYTSPDVIDRRNGQTPTLSDRVRGLVIAVRDDYNSSLKGQTPLVVGPNDAAHEQAAHEDAVKRIHMRIRGLFQEGS